MDITVVTTVVGTLCGVIGLLYKREAARADRMERKYEEALEFQRRDMTQMINGYARITLDYTRIIRSEMPDDLLPPSDDTPHAGPKRPKK